MQGISSARAPILYPLNTHAPILYPLKTSDLLAFSEEYKWEHLLRAVSDILFECHSFWIIFCFINPESTKKPEVFRDYQMKSEVRISLSSCETFLIDYAQNV